MKKVKRVKFSTKVDEELLNKFRVKAVEVYGMTRGSLMYALEEAMKMWLNAHETAHIRSNPKPNVKEVFREVVQYLKEQYFPTGYIPSIVPRKFLEEAIMSVRNVKDPRAIQNWLSAFASQGLIKYDTRMFTLKTVKAFEFVI